VSASGRGTCSLCGQRVYGTDGTDANPGRVNAGGGKRRPHAHKRPFTVRMDERDDTYDHGWRGWMDVAERMGAL
jgi:hypothetical protein